MEWGEILLTSSFTVFIYMVIMWLISLAGRDASIIDVIWGPGFVLIASVLLLQFPQDPTIQMFVSILVMIWGYRLALHIFLRKIGRGEDWRYAQLRHSWNKSFGIRSFLQVYMLQGILMLIVAAPLYIVALERLNVNLTLSSYIGASIWLIGFMFETVGDWQLNKFLAKSKNKGKIMTTGLWRYTRHPNYFGEVSLWWGLFIIVAPLSYGWIAIVSPITITLLLLWVSGIPMLENKYDKIKEFRAYKRRTSVFFPFPPKKTK